MFRSRVSRRATTTVLLIGLIPAMTGCHGWQTETATATLLAASPQRQPADTAAGTGKGGQRDTVVTLGRTRVTTDSGRFEFQSSRIANDSLFGRADDSPSEVAIPVAAINNVQVWGFSTGKTVGLVAGITAGVAAILLVSTLAVESTLCGISYC